MHTYKHPAGFTVFYDPVTGFLGIPRMKRDHRSKTGEYICPIIKGNHLEGGAISRNGVKYIWVEILRWISNIPDGADLILHMRDPENGLQAANLSWLTRSDFRSLTNPEDRITTIAGVKPYRVVVGRVYIGIYATLAEAQEAANNAVQIRLGSINELPFTY